MDFLHSIIITSVFLFDMAEKEHVFGMASAPGPYWLNDVLTLGQRLKVHNALWTLCHVSLASSCMLTVLTTASINVHLISTASITHYLPVVR